MGERRGTKVLSGAEFMGQKNLLLEAQRKDRYKNQLKVVDTKLIAG
jgi:predicted metallo-beta-lactamase superfamily hydrolase